MKTKLTIIGAGPAGLAAGHYAKKKGIDFQIFESENFVGGNCHTYKEGDFLFDTGAHRLHDKIPEVTAELLSILGEDLFKVSAPSYIYSDNKFFIFPFQLKDLIQNLGILTFLQLCFEILIYKFKKSEDNFENLALRNYGKTISSKFLLNYSEKLWGTPCSKLSTVISGSRLKGLNLKAYLNNKTTHLDGMEFYYPKYGYGNICDRLAEICGNIELNSRITKIYHDHDKIREIEINNQNKIKVDNLISTLPLTNLIKSLNPSPPNEIISAARNLKFRNLILF